MNLYTIKANLKKENLQNIKSYIFRKKTFTFIFEI